MPGHNDGNNETQNLAQGGQSKQIQPLFVFIDKEDGWIRCVNCLYEDRLDTIKLKYEQIS